MKENARSRLQTDNVPLASKYNPGRQLTYSNQHQTKIMTFIPSNLHSKEKSRARLSFDQKIKKNDYLSHLKPSIPTNPQCIIQSKPKFLLSANIFEKYTDQTKVSERPRQNPYFHSSLEFNRPAALERYAKRNPTALQNSGSSDLYHSLYDSEFGKKILSRTKLMSRDESKHRNGLNFGRDQSIYKRGGRQESKSLIKDQIQSILSNPRYGNGIKNTLRQAKKLVDTQTGSAYHIPKPFANHKKTRSVLDTGNASTGLVANTSISHRPMSHQNYNGKSKLSPRKPQGAAENSQISIGHQMNNDRTDSNIVRERSPQKCFLPDLDDSNGSIKQNTEKIIERKSAIVGWEDKESIDRNLLTVQSAVIATTKSKDQISLLPFFVEDDEDVQPKSVSIPMMSELPAVSSKTEEETDTGAKTGSKSGFGGFSEAVNRRSNVTREGDMGMRNRAKKTEFTFISQEKGHPSPEPKLIDTDSINEDFAHLKENPKNTLSEDINKLAGDATDGRNAQKNQKDNLFSNYLVKKFENNKFEISSGDEFIEDEERRSNEQFDEDSKIFDVQMNESIKNQKLKRTFSDDFSSSPKVRTEYGIRPELVSSKCAVGNAGHSPIHDVSKQELPQIRSHYEKCPKKQILLDPKYKPSDNVFTIKPKEMITLGKGMFIPLDELEDEANKKFESVKKWQEELNRQEVRSKIGCKSVQFQFTEEDKQILEKGGQAKGKMQTSPKHADDKTSKNSKCEQKRDIIVSKRSVESIVDEGSDSESAKYLEGLSPQSNESP
jgi:hypothetical protein